MKLGCLVLVTRYAISAASLRTEGREASWTTGCGSKMYFTSLKGSMCH